MAKTGGDILVETLISWGVDTIFGIPGDGINGVFEALRERQDEVSSSRYAMRKRAHSPPAPMPSSPASSGFCSRPRVPAASIC